jgi:hypothetical protein
MQKSIHLFLFIVIGFGAAAQDATTVLKQMHDRYRNGPCKCYTFSQKNTHYKADTVSGHSDWHEKVEFPDKFRIDFGDPAKKNFVVFRNDSSYRYDDGKIIKQEADANILLLLLGGMYYRQFDDVTARLKKAGFDLSKYSSGDWDGRPMYILGASVGDAEGNQFWVEKSTLRVFRILEKDDKNSLMDMRFESHQTWCKGYVENKVSFRRNGELKQVEEYYDIKEARSFY